jgi:hypothetical protein
VVYLALKAGNAFKRRIEAWRRQHERTAGAPFYLNTSFTDLIKDHAQLIAEIAAQCERPALVVIDTLNRSLVGSESKDEDMGAYISAGEAVGNAFECAVAVVHHCGIAGDRPRGHTSLPGAVTAQLAIKRDKDEGLILIEVEHLKDGEEGAKIVAELEVIELGEDEDGDMITSCVVVKSQRPPPEPKPKKLSAKYQAALDCLNELVVQKGFPPPKDWGPHPMVVEAGVWCAALEERGIIKCEDASQLRKRFWDLKRSLVERKIIGERGLVVWSCT